MRMFNATKLQAFFSVGNLIFFFRMQTEVYKPTEEGKSFIYCGESRKNSVVCRAAWIEFENELCEGSSDALCIRGSLPLMQFDRT